MTDHLRIESDLRKKIRWSRLIGKLGAPALRFRKRFSSKALILMYHCIGEREFDPWKMCVTPGYFAEHLTVLRKNAYPICLTQLVQKYKENTIPDKAVVITFDDGYADNFYCAKPILEEYNFPATVFIANGLIEHEHGFWWDELEQIIMQPESLPDNLSLCIDGKNFLWSLSQSENGDRELLKPNKEEGIKWLQSANPRLSLYFALHRRLQPLSMMDQRLILDDLCDWAGIESEYLPKYPSLSQEELMSLNHGELIELGSHTATHPYLSALPENIQINEIQQSKLALENILEKPVKSFSYPYGNYSRETISLVQAAGYDCACTIIKDVFWSGSDLFQLPRLGVENLNGEEFEKWLSGMFKVNS